MANRTALGSELTPFDVVAAMRAGDTLAIFNSPNDATFYAEHVNAYDGEPASILPSSGSTGRSKLAIVPWTVSIARGQAVIDAIGEESFDVVGIPQPSPGMYNSSIFPVVPLCVHKGKKLAMLNVRAGGWTEIDKFGVTIFIGTNFPDYLPGELTGNSLRSMLFIGRHMSEGRYSYLAKRSRATIFNLYGSVETSGVACTDGRPIVGGLAGKPLPGTQVRIVDGLIETNSPTLAKGYLDGTQLKLTPDGWFQSGDPGYIDDQGQLYVTNATRIKGLR